MANTATMAASNLRGLGMSTAYFDHGQNKILIKGFGGKDDANNNDLFYGQEIPFGRRLASCEYIPYPNPDSDMTMSVPAFPNAVITRDKNSFYIDGIPESAWGSITLQIAHVNPSTPFIISEGGGLTKDFINNPVNRFGSYLNFGPTASYTWEYSLYSVRMGSALSNENPQLEEKAILFPNPTSGTLYVSEKIMNNYDSVEIFDISGRLISNTKLTSEISLHDNPPGLYMIKMFNSETGVSEIKKIGLVSLKSL